LRWARSYQIQLRFLRSHLRLLDGHNTQLLAVCADQSDFTVADLVIDHQIVGVYSRSPLFDIVWHEKIERAYITRSTKKPLKEPRLALGRRVRSGDFCLNNSIVPHSLFSVKRRPHF